jgi:hypothetical protein
LGQELAAAGEPVTSIQAQIIPIAPMVFLDLGTYSASSARRLAQRRRSIFSRPSFTATRLGLALSTL